MMTMSRIKWLGRAVCAVVVCVSLISPVSAAVYWDGGGTGDDWNTADNWDPNGVPGSADNCYFDAGDNGELNGGTGGCNDLYVGYTSGTASLRIFNGGALTTNSCGLIGVTSGSTGAVTVDGADSTWNNGHFLDVGCDGNGTLDILNGGRVESAYGIIGYNSGSTGVVTVDGTDSLWTNSVELRVGRDGNGTLEIKNGGRVESDYSVIGDNSGSTGAVTVNGTGSLWTSGNLYVGDDGNGTLNILNGGLVEVGGNTSVATGGSIGAIVFDNGTLTTGGFFGDEADLSGTGTINTHGLVSNMDLVFDATHGLTQTLTLNGPGQNITVNLDVDGSASMGVGYNGNGSMHISDGVVVQSHYGYIGHKSGSTGTVMVDGVGSTWNNSELLYVGRNGSGTLEITNGGAVTNTDCDIGHWSGSTGAVTVDGAGSLWTNSGELHVGRYGNGTLDILNGGLVEVSGDTSVAATGSTSAIVFDNGTLTTGGFFGDTADLSGTGTINTHGLVSNVDLVFDAAHGLTQTLTLNGPGQNITVNLDVDGSASMGVGYNGDGSMHISDGVVVQSYSGYIGHYSGSTGTVTVNGAGSIWSNGGLLYVGLSGRGTLDITNGGAVTNTNCSIGGNSSSPSAVTVDGAGSLWTNSGELFVGRYGNGTLNIQNDGEVRVSGELSINSASTVNLYGGTLRVGSFDNSAGGAFNWTGGQMYVGTITGDLAVTGGTLCPGSSPGILSVSGDYSQTSGSLEIELGGLAPGTQHDVLDVAGEFSLGGTSILDVILYGGFNPSNGDTFDILDWGTFAAGSEFDTINLPGLDAGLAWDTSDLYNTGNLSVTPEPATLSLLAIGGLTLLRRRRHRSV